MNLTKLRFDVSKFKVDFKRKTTLSTYFPKGTQFYYGYPAGEDSGFLNRVSPATEELVAARVFCNAGPSVMAVGFSSSVASREHQAAYETFNIPQLPKVQTVIMPDTIHQNLTGRERNEAIRKFLKKSVTPGMFVMAQPYLDRPMEALYQIPPTLTAWLNDKNNMEHYIASNMLPKRYGVYKSGAEFASKYTSLSLPVVIKASSSSSGDGVYLCRKQEDLDIAAAKLKRLNGTVLAEQLIDIKKNYGMHFGIPADATKPIDLLGINEQIVTDEGAFLGGIIRSREIPDELAQAAVWLRDKILPAVREMGWHGIGGFDVLIDKDNNAYFIDCNFRMTGMSAYHFMIANNEIKHPMLSIGGEFHGSQEEIISKLAPYAGVEGSKNFMQIITLTCYKNIWRFNAAVTFSNEKQLKDQLRTLLKAGVVSQTIEQFLK